MSEQIRPLIAGNWKMNGLASALAEIDRIAEGVSGLQSRIDALICPPATLLMAASSHVLRTSLLIGAQDCSSEIHGAYTGDISAEMVADSGARAVIVGHSERRLGHHESNATVLRKSQRAQEAGLQAIVCIGETESEMLEGHTESVLLQQLKDCVPSLGAQDTIVIAYEPVWAIGTGRTPTLDNIAKLHGLIRSHLIDAFGHEGSLVRILYGGSVKAENAVEIAALDHVNGALVGGASLKSQDFLAIARAFGS